MTMTNRITPEIVEEAVGKNGNIKLVCNTWANYSGSTIFKCACAISQVLISKGVTFDDVMAYGNMDLEESAPIAAEKAGLHPEYVEGFVYGFDGSRPKGKTELMLMGYEDGCECRTRLKPIARHGY